MCSRLTICSITWPSSSSCPAQGRFTSTRMSRSSGGAKPVPASRKRSSSETRSPTPPICRCGSRAGPAFSASSGSKNNSRKKGELYQLVRDTSLVLGYSRDTYKRETCITSSVPAEMDPRGLSYTVHLGPHEEWHTAIDVRVPTAAQLLSGEEYAKPEVGVPTNGRERRAQHVRSWP